VNTRLATKAKSLKVEVGPRQGRKRKTVRFFEEQLKGEEALTLAGSEAPFRPGE
jgi:hypothetical protein